MAATQGEKITKISTQMEFVVVSLSEIKEDLKHAKETYATKVELKEKAGIWTEGWIKVIAFATAGAIIVQIVVNAL